MKITKEKVILGILILLIALALLGKRIQKNSAEGSPLVIPGGGGKGLSVNVPGITVPQAAGDVTIICDESLRNLGY